MTTRRQRVAAKQNIKKAAKAARRKENGCTFAEKDAHRAWQRRSQGCTKETNRIDMVSRTKQYCSGILVVSCQYSLTDTAPAKLSCVDVGLTAAIMVVAAGATFIL